MHDLDATATRTSRRPVARSGVETRVGAGGAEGRSEGDVLARAAHVGAVMSAAAGACPRTDQHGSRAEGMTAGAPRGRALDPSIARSMEGRREVTGGIWRRHPRHPSWSLPP
ncbi:MAG: hypothetical protein WBB62_22325 [Rhodococcus sp. (in: high G+C Gram-positive bacteria)]|uniref:hypothetical protein n=1 Tax=Rhodococcus sp. I2R TaxID=2855445 RepID=UPI001E59A9A7|nr:hypothetical protein [Rhodococcus sp. I2R]MCC8928038.1 hypothetical protein [Rhodococcus sp. I2R]